MMGRLELLIGVLLILNASFRYLMWALLNLSIHAYFLHYIFSGRYMNMYYGIKKRDQINTYMDGDQYVHGWRSICTWMEINAWSWESLHRRSAFSTILTTVNYWFKVLKCLGKDINLCHTFWLFYKTLFPCFIL